MKKLQPTVTWTAEQVWGAACTAQRINGEYLKQSEFDADGKIELRRPNRAILYRALEGAEQITSEDLENGRQCLQHFKGLLMKQLSGKALNDFESVVLILTEKEQFTNADSYHIAVLASLPASWERSVERDKRRHELELATEESTHIGNTGDRVAMEVNVLRSVYSQKYNTMFITAVDEDKHVVFFAHRDSFQAGTNIKIAGTVKRRCDQGQTQLNRVKVIV